MSTAAPLVWIVDSAYTGELNARLGVAERLGYGYETIPLPDGDAEAYGRCLQGRYTAACQGRLPRPLVVLSGTGEDTTGPIADLKGVFGHRLLNVFLASILPDEPDPRLAEYDLVASPQLRGGNIVTTVGVPHRVTDSLLAQAHRRHAPSLAGLARPLAVLLVGGNTRYCFGFDEDHARDLGRRVARLVGTLQGGLAVTNSRRTPPAALDALLEALHGLDYRFFDWRQAGPDLYPALLAGGDVFVATGDSVSMCSEVSRTGKPLLVDLNEQTTEIYHRDIVGRLIAHGAARLFEEGFAPWTYVPPDPAGAVAEAILARLANLPASSSLSA